jgi:hypothetical protein
VASHLTAQKAGPQLGFCSELRTRGAIGITELAGRLTYRLGSRTVRRLRLHLLRCRAYEELNDRKDGPNTDGVADGQGGYRQLLASASPPDRSEGEYELWVTLAEKDAMAKVLSSCSDQSPPTPADAAMPASF